MPQVDIAEVDWDWEEEGKFFFEEWEKHIKEKGILAYGNSDGLKWRDLSQEIQLAWIKVAERAYDLYWA